MHTCKPSFKDFRLTLTLSHGFSSVFPLRNSPISKSVVQSEKLERLKPPKPVMEVHPSAPFIMNPLP